MEAYKTYQEAKIAHPNSLIMVRDNSFDAMENIATSQINRWEECEPRNYCMTVKQFLDGNNKFIYGDVLLTNERTEVRVVGVTYSRDDMSVDTCNAPDNDIDCEILVLKAAALDKPKPRTKVEYEKVKSVFKLKVEEMRNGVYGWLNDDGEFFPSTNEALTVGALTTDSLYRKVERPIEWWEDVFDFIKGAQVGAKGYAEVIDDRLLIEASMTREQWCDLARILLEQEGE